jgi:hypothetical protein
MNSMLQPFAKYQQFRDPVGLVSRMLRSRDSGATFALTRAALELLATPIDLALRPFERRLIAAAQGNPLPIVQVVGPPRSGTTMVYQVLSQSLPYAYFDNLNSLFPRSAITAGRLFGVSKRRPNPQTRSYYGNTSGLRGTNDAFHVWDRWLGEDRSCVVDPLPASVQEDMQRFFRAWFAHFPRPLLTKHNQNLLCMETLAKALPSTIFVVIARDPVYTAQSLLIARERIQGDRRIPWGLGAPKGQSPDAVSDPVLDVANQVRTIFTSLRKQIRTAPSERVLCVRYSDFCKAPGHWADEVHRLVGQQWSAAARLQRPAAEATGLDNENRVRIPTGEFERLEQLLADKRDELESGRLFRD